MKKIFMVVLLVIVFLMNYTYVFAGLDNSREIIDMRTENRKVYSMGNNVHRFQFFTNPIHYFDTLNNRYSEINQKLVYDKKSEKYTTSSSNYRVKLPTSVSIDSKVNLKYYELYDLDIDFINNQYMRDSLVSKEEDIYASYKSNISNQLKIIPQNDILKFITTLSSHRSSRQIKFRLYSSKLNLIEDSGTFYFVDAANVSIFHISDYYLKDSNGNISMKINVKVHELENDAYEFHLLLDEKFLDDNFTTYPVNIIGAFEYSLLNQNGYIRDKTFVKNTDEEYDLDFFTVAKQKYYPFQNIPVYLTEYHSYSILELNFGELIGPNVTILDAKLYLNRTQSNVNSKIQFSHITDSDFDLINGYSSYNRVLISQPTVNSESLVFDITNEIEEQISNNTTKLLLELSPEHILLGNFNIKYMNFASENAHGLNSPYYTIDVTGINLNSNFGSAAIYESNSNVNLNCFGYALKMDDIWVNIITQAGIIDFSNVNSSNMYLHQVIVPAVLYTINSYPFYSARVLYTINEPISENEYRIALRIGNTITNKIFYTTPGNLGPYVKNDDYHFMIQHSDGSWSHKVGNLPSIHLNSVMNPSEINWDSPFIDYSTSEFFPNHYNSFTIYFAIVSRKAM